LGHGAWNSVPVQIKGYKVDEALAKRVGSIAGLNLIMETRFPEGETPLLLKNYIKHLKELTGGVPVAIKIGTTHYLEAELTLMIEAGADVLVFDGSEGGTHGGPPILQDDLGIPTFPSICRAVRFLEGNNYRSQVSLVVGGGLYGPGDFLKCLALGADAVIIGTVAALAMSHSQVTKALPWEPPTGIIYHLGKEEYKYQPELGSVNLANFMKSCVLEMEETVRTLGKKTLREIKRSDLVALDPGYAAIAGIDYLQPGKKG
jgi:methylamine---glutamate N-methyltransferase subunit C